MSELRIDASVFEQYPMLSLVREDDAVTIKVNGGGILKPLTPVIYPMNLPMTDLDTIPWSVIDEIGKNGLARTYFALGATKKDFMKNGFVAEYQIIGFDHDDLADGSGKAPITWDMVRVYKDDLYMKRNGDEACWDTSNARAYLNGEFFNNMSDELQAIVKPVIKLTADASGTGNLIESVDRVWLKSEQEQFGRKIYSHGGEGHWYELFMLEDVPYFKIDDDEDRRWNWLRSVYSGSSYTFCAVNTGGSAGTYNSGHCYGVAPDFCS